MPDGWLYLPGCAVVSWITINGINLRKSLHMFQCTVLIEIRTHVTWLKSTLLLKIECQETHIYMKTECLQTKLDATLF